MTRSLLLLLLAGLTFLPAANAAAELDPRLAELQPFTGKTYVGTFNEPGRDDPVRDVQVWEVILGGKAIRITHSLNDGAYGGESIVFYDTKLDRVAYYYFTTADFYTHGTMTQIDGVWTAHEMVEGDEQGVTEVRSTSQLLPDGRLLTKSEYLQNGEWVQGHEAVYEESPDAKPVFDSAQ